MSVLLSDANDSPHIVCQTVAAVRTTTDVGSIDEHALYNIALMTRLSANSRCAYSTHIELHSSDGIDNLITSNVECVTIFDLITGILRGKEQYCQLLWRSD